MPEQPAASAPYVFLSYASVDRERALAIANALEASGVRVWLDRQAIAAGTSWSAEIVRGIQGAAAVAVLCSAAAYASPNVQRELDLAVEENRALLPLLLEPGTAPAEVRYALAGRQWLELLDRAPADWLPQVLQALARLGITPVVAVKAQSPELEMSGTPGVLPAPLTSFIGRARELADVAAAIEATRLLTLTGPGGTGKTRLAIAAAQQLAARFEDGAWFVDLSGVGDPNGVLPSVALLFGVAETEGRSLALSLAAFLRRKHLLLVLDNFEQVLGAARAVYDLLAGSARLRLIITSRELLRIEGEQEYVVPPLPLPAATESLGLEAMALNPAVQLFLERARALRPELRLDAEMAAAISDICRRLDGLPLAIELAAARVKLLPPAALLARLDHALPLLTGAGRSQPARQQTLRAAMAWSWDLLSASEQRLFRRLGVFAGGWTMDAAESVCNPDGDLDVLEGLASLVDKSLVRQSELTGESRFGMLVTLREFALERLAEANETNRIAARSTEYYCRLVESGNARWQESGRAQADLFGAVDPERDNIVASLQRAVALPDVELALRLAGSLDYWFYSRMPAEGRRWLTTILALPVPPGASLTRGLCLGGLWMCCAAQGETDVGHLEEAAAQLRAVKNVRMLSWYLAMLGCFLPPSESARAVRIGDEAITIARAGRADHQIANAEVRLGMTLLHVVGDRAAARGHLEGALHIARSLGADVQLMISLQHLAALSLFEARLEEAESETREALAIADALGERLSIAMKRVNLALIAARRADETHCAEEWTAVLRLAQELDSMPLSAIALAGVARLAATGPRRHRAAQLLAGSERAWARAQQLSYFVTMYPAAYQPALAAAEQALDAEEYAREWAIGRTQSLDQSVSLAFEELNLRAG